jgi:UDP-N-acetylglucosamine 2-epimerase (non-hydrolysing)
MKAAPVLEALELIGVDQLLVHTGQHYDDKLSAVFFDELSLPVPDFHLGVGSGSHAVQTAHLLEALEALLVEVQPSGVVVYGDINSTLAAALAAVKMGIPVAHIESGLRSFDRDMPEEINRVVTDAIADLHLTTSPEALDNLVAEGRPAKGVHFVGNPMIDTLEKVRLRLDAEPVLVSLGIESPYVLVTMHRPANVDGGDRVAAIVAALADVGSEIPIIFPVHPRGRGSLDAAGLSDAQGVHVIDPLGYMDFTSLMSQAAVVITDSGGVQEETTMLDVPCLTVRPNTERPITISHGTNRLVEPDEVIGATRAVLAGDTDFGDERPPLWDGLAGQRIAAVLDVWGRDRWQGS